MTNFSKTSKDKLAECHPKLQALFNEVIRYYDCSIIVGHRGEAQQNQAFIENRSKLKYPQSKHNSMPSRAVDAVPWFKTPPHIRWDDREKFYHFGGFVQAVAAEMGIDIRWGGDWNCNFDLNDQTFFDLPHFELRWSEKE